MPVGADGFNLDQTMQMIGQAFYGVTCHIWFDAALHGLAIAVLIGLTGLVLKTRNHRYGRPLMAVCWKLGLFCLLLVMPGALALLISGTLPPTGAFKISSLGFIVFWSWISLHLSAEEMNFQWF